MKVKFVPYCLGTYFKQRVREDVKFFDSIDELKEFIIAAGIGAGYELPTKEEIDECKRLDGFWVLYFEEEE